MAHYDLIVREGDVVTGAGRVTTDLGVTGGQIVAMEPALPGTATRELDAHGLLVLPGAIDPHVHFNEPGRTDWEGWSSGSRAAAAGGVTTCIEMPLNANPPTINRSAFEAKLAAAQAASQVDFALWGGLTPDSLDHMEDLAAAGVVGFKAFMSATGTDDFRRADDDVLLRGMEIAAGLGLPVAVHAENDAITSGLADRSQAAGATSMRDYLASRPVVAEVEAIGRAIALAGAAGCSLHVVHVSTGQGVAVVAEAQARGMDVTCETCPHYLAFSADDAERIGALAKCAPPLRGTAVRESLWETLLAGDVDMIASDHSPALPSMKTSTNAFENWGGISGCQHLVAVGLTLGLGHGVPLSELVRMLATNAGRRFALPGKGEIALGADADLVLWSRQEPTPVRDVRYRHPASAWDGFPVGWFPATTLLRGKVVAGPGTTERPAGRFIPGPYGMVR